MTYILGVNCGSAASHDPSACLVDSRGAVVAFIEEERLTRMRHAPGAIPVRAIARCLDLADIVPHEVDAVAIGWDEPRLRARRGLPWEFDTSREFLAAVGLGGKRWPDMYFVPHHRAHAASAFYACPYDAAAILVVDGNGEDESASIFWARWDEPLIRLASWPRVCSLGYLYEAVSDWLGLGRQGAGKTMGLAAYGRADDTGDPGWLTVNSGNLVSMLGTDPLLDYDDLMKMWQAEIVKFAAADRSATPAEDLASDPVAIRVAWAAQTTVESAVTWLAGQAREATGIDELCIAGGVGLNCAANGRLAGPLYVPPVPHDAGVALGAAWSVVPPRERQVFSAYVGGSPGPRLDGLGATVAVAEPVDVDRIVGLLADGQIVAVCRGRSEVGPRALCHRSLLASPVTSPMRDKMNRLKQRERWRPFGPVTNADHDLWSSAGELERYMVGAATLTERGINAIPAVRHVDNTTRPQRLRAGDEDFVNAVLDGLAKAGHPPVLVNTSFNGPGEPLVETAAEAVDCALRLGVEFVILGDELLCLTGKP